MRISDWSSDVCSSDLLYEPAEALQFYANVSRAAEVPTFYELVQGTVQQFVPLDVQRSWTAEVGSRGSAGPVSWDVSAYRAWVRGELLAYRSEEHTSELQSLMRISYAVFCLKKKTNTYHNHKIQNPNAN